MKILSVIKDVIFFLRFLPKKLYYFCLPKTKVFKFLCLKIKNHPRGFEQALRERFFSFQPPTWPKQFYYLIPFENGQEIRIHYSFDDGNGGLFWIALYEGKKRLEVHYFPRI